MDRFRVLMDDNDNGRTLMNLRWFFFFVFWSETGINMLSQPFSVDLLCLLWKLVWFV